MNTTADGNTATGAFALQLNSANHNTAIGAFALNLNTTGGATPLLVIRRSNLTKPATATPRPAVRRSY